MGLRGHLYCIRSLDQGGLIRSFGVGLLALATVAAASFFLRRRVVVTPTAGRQSAIDALYAAGL